MAAPCILMLMERFAAERSGINLYSEYSLHAQLKEALARPGDRLEVLIEGKVVDLLRADGELVEVQTGHLGQIAPKVLAFAARGRRVRIVYPVSAELSIRRLDPATGELDSVRRSPKRGELLSLFDELIRAPGLIAAPGITVEVLTLRTVETRVRDGSGSWWRKGDRTVDKELVEILASRSFSNRKDWLALIPAGLAPPWTSESLGAALGVAPSRARKLLYCLRRAALLAESTAAGRRKAYIPTKPGTDVPPASPGDR